jgi:DNA-binding SARP family transcriptional activator
VHQLRLLGQLALAGADGGSLDALLAQPKRLALLAFLAVDAPLRLHRRDALLLLFWPDSDEAHARGALSQALSFLRRTLGPAMIVTRGSDEVGVAEGTIDSDVARFRASVESGGWRKALSEYKGPFLPGFNLDGCHEFDEWLSAERAILREAAVKCARALAREAAEAGDKSGAVAAGMHELLLAPLDEGAAQRVVLALARAGRRSAALEEYRAFSARLRTELGIAPSASLAELVALIRSGETGPGWDRGGAV